MRITYISPEGKKWNLTAAENVSSDSMFDFPQPKSIQEQSTSGDSQGVFLLEGGINGLVGETEDINVRKFSGSQTYVSSHATPMEGSLQVHIFGIEGKSVQEVYREWRGSWSHREYGTINISFDDTGTVSCRVRLSKTIEHPVEQPGKSSSISVEVPVICDDGYWTRKHVVKRTANDTSDIKIRNYGDFLLYPQVKWTGPTTVTVPSLNTFQLPKPSSGARRINLDPESSFIIQDDNEKVDISLWKKSTDLVVPEGVPPRETRTFKLLSTADVYLYYDVRLLDPWR